MHLSQMCNCINREIALYVGEYSWDENTTYMHIYVYRRIDTHKILFPYSILINCIRRPLITV